MSAKTIAASIVKHHNARVESGPPARVLGRCGLKHIGKVNGRRIHVRCGENTSATQQPNVYKLTYDGGAWGVVILKDKRCREAMERRIAEYVKSGPWACTMFT